MTDFYCASVNTGSINAGRMQLTGKAFPFIGASVPLYYLILVLEVQRKSICSFPSEPTLLTNK